VLLDTVRLAVVPGEAFNAPGRIRVCFAVDDATPITAIERLRTALGPTGYEPAAQQLEEAG
jgi:aspartate/methionine/tyrosine aminotransferase